MKAAWALALFLISTPLAAEVIPEPGIASPRIQTVRWQAGETIQLTALPGTGLTLMFEPGETITSVDADPALLTTRISGERDALLITPLREGALGGVHVTTARRSYAFSMRTGNDLMAAYLVRFENGTPAALAAAPVPKPMPPAFMPPTGTGQTWTYRVKGDRAVQPASITDDGARTYISFAEGAALPAIFAVGPTGAEQVVNSYMREGRLVIDQVWSELVFRVDASKAVARRSAKPDSAHG